MFANYEFESDPLSVAMNALCAMFILVIGLLIALFGGEPDIADSIMHSLSGGEFPEIAVSQ